MIVRALLAVVAMAGIAAAQPKLAANTGGRPAEDRRRIIGILDVHLDGVPKEIAKQFQRDLEAKLDSRAYWLAPQQRVKEMLGNSTKWTDGCVVGTCLAEVKVQTGADIVVLASITGAGTSFGYVVTLVRTDTGQFVSQDSNRCDVCTVKEALANATTAAVKLLTALPDTLPDEKSAQQAAFDVQRAEIEQTNRQTRHRHRLTGVILTAAGVLAAGAAFTTYLLTDHDSYALATAGAGAGLAVGGVLMLTF